MNLIISELSSTKVCSRSASCIFDDDNYTIPCDSFFHRPWIRIKYVYKEGENRRLHLNNIKTLTQSDKSQVILLSLSFSITIIDDIVGDLLPPTQSPNLQERKNLRRISWLFQNGITFLGNFNGTVHNIQLSMGTDHNQNDWKQVTQGNQLERFCSLVVEHLFYVQKTPGSIYGISS